MSVAVLPRIRWWFPQATLDDTARGIKAVLLAIILRLYNYFSYEILITNGKDPFVFQLSVMILCVLMLRLLSFAFYAHLRSNAVNMLFRLMGYVVVVALDYSILRATRYINNIVAVALVNIPFFFIYVSLIYSLALREEQHWPIARLWKELLKSMGQCGQVLQPFAVGALLAFMTKEYPQYGFLWIIYLGCIACGWFVVFKNKGRTANAYDAGRINGVALVLVLLSAITATALRTLARTK